MPIRIPENATFRQLQFVDARRAVFEPNTAAAIAQHSKAFPTIRIMIQNTELPVRVCVADLCQVLGLPAYSLQSPFRPSVPRQQGPPDNLHMEDDYHISDDDT